VVGAGIARPTYVDDTVQAQGMMPLSKNTIAGVDPQWCLVYVEKYA